MIYQVSLFLRFFLLLSIPKTKQSVITSRQARLFFRAGKHQKSPSVVPIDFTEFAEPETIKTPMESEPIADTALRTLVRYILIFKSPFARGI